MNKKDNGVVWSWADIWSISVLKKNIAIQKNQQNPKLKALSLFYQEVKRTH